MIPFNDENRDKMLRVAEFLRGTCKGLEDGLETEFGEGVDVMQFDIELLRTLDDEVMLCDACGWWVETHEIDEYHADQVCAECSGDGQ